MNSGLLKNCVSRQVLKAIVVWSGLLLLLFVIAGLLRPRPVLLVNAHILTMDDSLPVAQALLMQGGRIAAVGRREALERELPAFTKTIDLHGRTVLPGFVDAHSHFPSAGLAEAFLNLASPPIGDVVGMETLLQRIADYGAGRTAGQWLVGFNYDDASLAERRHPSREELDRLFPDHPVYLWHRSGHMGVANSLALTELGHEDMNGPERAEKEPGFQPERDTQGKLTGLLQEGAAPRLGNLLRRMPLQDLFSALLNARDVYLQAGVTTVQNGFADLQSMRLLRWSQRLGIVPQRIVLWPAYGKLANRISLPETTAAGSDESLALQEALNWFADSDKYSLSALKITIDGSPQGRTAWLTEPYLFSGSRAPDYRGYPAVPLARARTMILAFHKAGIQLALHGNGDAAIDFIIATLAEAQNEHPRPHARHIIVHAQTIREDQLPELAALGATVTFFPAHTYYWGDWYRQHVLGDERARTISPLALADKYQLPYSLHSDAPVTPVSPMQILWSATRRETVSGFVLGPELIISRERALRAMTIDAAWQSRLEHDRGSLQVGKLADIIVLSGDPLLEPDVRSLQVERVWIGGRDVFQRGAGPR